MNATIIEATSGTGKSTLFDSARHTDYDEIRYIDVPLDNAPAVCIPLVDLDRIYWPVYSRLDKQLGTSWWEIEGVAELKDDIIQTIPLPNLPAIYMTAEWAARIDGTPGDPSSYNLIHNYMVLLPEAAHTQNLMKRDRELPEHKQMRTIGAERVRRHMAQRMSNASKLGNRNLFPSLYGAVTAASRQIAGQVLDLSSPEPTFLDLHEALAATVTLATEAARIINAPCVCNH